MLTRTASSVLGVSTLAVGLLLSSLARLEGQTTLPAALDVIRNTDRLLNGESKHAVVEMTIVRPRWQRALKMETWSQGDDRWLVRILEPPKEAGIGSLRIAGEMWNYLPRIEKVVKINPSMLGQSWMGSDLTYDELLKASSIVNDYDHQLKSTDLFEGQPVYRIESVAKPKAPVVWARQVYWIRTRDFVPVRQEFWSEAGELIKAVSFGDVREFKGRPFPTKWEVRPAKKPAENTVLRFEKVEFDLAIPAGTFTLQNLKAVR